MHKYASNLFCCQYKFNTKLSLFLYVVLEFVVNLFFHVKQAEENCNLTLKFKWICLLFYSQEQIK